MGWNLGYVSDFRCFFDSLIDVRFIAYCNVVFLTPSFGLMLILYGAIVYNVCLDQRDQIRPVEMRTERHVDNVTWQRELKTTQMFAIISLVFLVLWYPLFLLYTIEAFSTSVRLSQTTVNVITVMSHSTSALNPVLYGLTDSTFRACYTEAIHSRCVFQHEARRHASVTTQTEQPNGSVRMADEEDSSEL
ncbi:PREDICTED: adenosine receptor A1-like [Priapulus caudatus]|uniref:Adenosine receptor A1-like n=1 Tax=Priapulus caudatus TaxID=37621 RepID=A0ABM1E9C3_PRICU|nr:PREDICTED: adenosine receptor A1-like [Priapulus caudatus]